MYEEIMYIKIKNILKAAVCELEMLDNVTMCECFKETCKAI